MVYSDPGNKGFTLIELLALIAIVAVVAAVFVPGLASSHRASNERQGCTALKTLTSAEADFRANDRDGNGVNDFWTGDVKGLYTMTSARVRGAGGDRSNPPLKLIELAVAAADVDGTLVPAGGVNMALQSFTPSSPAYGYWFLALDTDLSLRAEDPERLYRADTGGSLPMGKCHHLSKFGFIAIPDTLAKAKYVFLVNENNTIVRRALECGVFTNSPVPPGREAVPENYRNWPSDGGLSRYWSKFD